MRCVLAVEAGRLRCEGSFAWFTLRAASSTSVSARRIRIAYLFCGVVKGTGTALILWKDFGQPILRPLTLASGSVEVHPDEKMKIVDPWSMSSAAAMVRS